MKRSYKSGSSKRFYKKQKEKQLNEILDKTRALDKLWTPMVMTHSYTTQSSGSSTVDEYSKESLSSDAEMEKSTPAHASDTEFAEFEMEIGAGDRGEMQVLTDGFSCDLGTWSTPSEITEEMREFWIERGSSECQHSMGPFTQSAQKQSSSSKRLRFCTQALFTRVHVNGEKVGRNWLCYSPTIGNVYCFMCKLMPKQTKDPGIFSNVGFRDWKHADRAISRHEGSKYHRDSILAVMTLGTVSGRIDTQIVEASKYERQYWRDVLARVVAVVKFLAERGFPFRGHNEIFGSPTNGNFMGILELLSKFDPFLAQHIERYGAKGRGNSSYLSSTICDEFIKIMGEHVLKHIVNELKSAKYFSVTVDSSPDISHVDLTS